LTVNIKTFLEYYSDMDKLRRALSGDDRQPDEESGIMPQVKIGKCK
jgi:hypothetical protein